MALVIIYPRTDGGVCVVSGFDQTKIMEIALSTTPTGRPFVIIDDMVLPDRFYRDAWVHDFDVVDGFGAEGGVADQDDDFAGQVKTLPWPTSRFAALPVTGLGLRCDMLRARELHRRLIRLVRESAWSTLDGLQTSAFVKGDIAEANRIESVKQSLRDAPANPAINSATTVDELKTVWPEVLPKPWR